MQEKRSAMTAQKKLKEPSRNCPNDVVGKRGYARRFYGFIPFRPAKKRGEKYVKSPWITSVPVGSLRRKKLLGVPGEKTNTQKKENRSRGDHTGDTPNFFKSRTGRKFSRGG